MKKQDTQFEDFLKSVEHNTTTKSAIQSAYKKYNLNFSDLARLTSADIRKIRTTLIEKQKYQQQLRIKMQSEWIECERKLFVWILVCYLAHNKKQIQNLEIADFEYLSNITTHKSIPLVKYLAFTLLKPNKRPVWTPEEDEILLSLLSNQDRYKTVGEWNTISRELFLRGKQESIKTSKNCRQRWCNHVDPKIRKDWTEKEDLTMLNYIKDHGKRWAKVAIQLGNIKSQHMVKNRYYALLRKIEKQMGSIKQKQSVDLLLKNYNQISDKNQPELQNEYKKPIVKHSTKQQIKIQSKNTAFVRPTSKEEDQENPIRLIISKNYSPQSDVVQQTFGMGLEQVIRFCPSTIFRQTKEDLIEQAREQSGEQKPRKLKGNSGQLKLNQSCYFGNPSPKAPTPHPLFFQSPLPQQGNPIDVTFYNFNRFMTAHK